MPEFFKLTAEDYQKVLSSTDITSLWQKFDPLTRTFTRIVSKNSTALDQGEITGNSRSGIPMITVLRYADGRIRWRVPGNTPEQNKQLGIGNFQGLFLDNFPDFNILFPREVDGKIQEDYRQAASQFIAKAITDVDFKRLTLSVHSRVSAPYFEGSYTKAVQKSFQPWGINVVIKDANGAKTQLVLAPSASDAKVDSKSGKFIDTGELEGWVRIKELAFQLNRHEDTIRRKAKKYLSEHPEWTLHLRSDVVFYSPALTAALRNDFPDYDKPPQGWVTVVDIKEALDQHFSKGHKSLKIIATTLVEDRPEWVRTFLDSSNKPCTFYSPQVSNLIMERILPNVSPEGWKVKEALIHELHCAARTIEAKAYIYTQEHPEWVRLYFDCYGRLKTHYAPELIILLTQDVNQDQAPAGWLSARFVAKELKRDTETIKKIASKFRREYPSWFGFFYAGNKLCEHFSPELADKIRQILSTAESKYAEVLEAYERQLLSGQIMSYEEFMRGRQA